MTLLSLCGPQCRPPTRADVHDARAGKDPTKTYRLRAKMRSEGDRRWQTMARTLRQALIELDLVGMKGVGRLAHGDKTEGFAAWLREELRHKVFGFDGSWVKPYVQQAAGIAQRRAEELAPYGEADPGRAMSMENLAVSELRGIVEAAQQRLTRVMTHSLMASDTPTQAANALSAVIEVMRNRTRAMGEYVIAKTHATTTLSAFRSAGVQQVGIIPERRRKQITRDAFDPDEPRDPLGRWTSVGGSVVAFHGTTDEVAQNIIKNGIKIGAGRSFLGRDKELYSGPRGQSVYVADSMSNALKWARFRNGVAIDQGNKPNNLVVFEVHIPKGEWSKFKTDEKVKEGAARAALNIPPQWITKATGFDAFDIGKKSAHDIPLLRDSDHVVKFLVVLVREADDTFDAKKPQARARLPWAALSPRRKPGSNLPVTKRPFKPIEEVPAYEEVDVLTAGDDDVCFICQDISDDGPYELADAEDLIPAHPWCRCAFVPAGKYAMDANECHNPSGPGGGQFCSEGGTVRDPGSNIEKVKLGERMYPVRDTSETIEQNQVSGAAIVEPDGSLSILHISDNPEATEKALQGTHPLTDMGSDHDDLGKGFYGSAMPQIWVSRSTGKWDFLNRLTPEQRDRYASSIKQEVDKQRERQYITQSEHERALRYLQQYKEGNPYIEWSADQPFNIRSWEPDNLKKLGIEPGKQPSLLKVNVAGRFVDLSNGGFRDSDLEKAQKSGFDGAYTTNSFSYTAQFVLWNRKAIKGVKTVAYGKDQIIEFFDRGEGNPYHKGAGPGGGQFTSGPEGGPFYYDFNPYHEPAGSSEGGRFTSGGGAEGPKAPGDLEKHYKEQFKKEIKERALGVAKDLGFPAKLMVFSEETNKFEIGGRTYNTAGTANLLGEVVIYINHVTQSSIEGVVAHEVMHQKFAAVLERDRSNERSPFGKAYRNVAGNPDSYATSDGVSKYSAKYWEGWQDNKYSLELAVNETLAEMARGKQQTGKLPEPDMGYHDPVYVKLGGIKATPKQMEKGRKRWVELYKAVEGTYARIRK